MSATEDIQRLVFAVMDANDAAEREGQPGANDVYVIPARLWFAVQDALRPSLTRDRNADGAEESRRPLGHRSSAPQASNTGRSQDEA